MNQGGTADKLLFVLDRENLSVEDVFLCSFGRMSEEIFIMGVHM